MWRWFSEAVFCVAYLTDVPALASGRKLLLEQFSQSSWFTRGWTLQEMLAPDKVIFCTRKWEVFGTKADQELLKVIRERTKIDEEFITNPANIQDACFAKRVSWVSERETTREEDMAYCLLGLLSVHMSLLYGEGLYNAFHRLQVRFIGRSDDESIFAWPSDFRIRQGAWKGIRPVLAWDPRDFQGAHSMETIDVNHDDYTFRAPYFMTNKGLIIETRARKLNIQFGDDVDLHPSPAKRFRSGDETVYLVRLNCRDTSNTSQKGYVIALKAWGSGDSTFRRIGRSSASGYWDWEAFWSRGRSASLRFCCRLSV